MQLCLTKILFKSLFLKNHFERGSNVQMDFVHKNTLWSPIYVQAQIIAENATKKIFKFHGMKHKLLVVCLIKDYYGRIMLFIFFL